MFSSIMVCGVQDAVLALLDLHALEQVESTYRAARKAATEGCHWATRACREISPWIIIPVPSDAVADVKVRMRGMMTALLLKSVAFPLHPLRLLRLRDAEDLAQAVDRNRRRACGLSAAGTTAHIVVNMFGFRFRPARPGREAALISTKVAVELARNGRQELWEVKLSLPAGGGAIVFGRSQGNAAVAAEADLREPTELYVDVFSVGTGGPSLQLVDAHLSGGTICAQPLFCAVSGAWGVEGCAENLTRGFLAVICFREVGLPLQRRDVSAGVQALSLDRGWLRR